VHVVDASVPVVVSRRRDGHALVLVVVSGLAGGWVGALLTLVLFVHA
jgi:hypothetical protein